MDHMEDAYDEKISDLILMTNLEGTRASAKFIVTGIYKKTAEGFPPALGQSYVLSCGAFFEVHNNKITRVTTYYNVQE